MAFVFGKTQKKSVFETTKSIPGPGQYNEPQRQQNEHSAPFNSSSFKQTEFDVIPTNTGPGSYNPAYSKSLYTEKKLRMTSSFHSKVERFKTDTTQAEPKSISMKVTFTEKDEPRKYNPNSQKQSFKEAMGRSKQKMGVLQVANNQRKINSIGVNKDFVRIILSNPQNTEMNHSVIIDSSIVKKENGPGSYNIQRSADLVHHKSMHVVDWSRNTIKRFKHEKNKNPGPGQYEVSPQPKRSISSTSAAFAYQGLRSYMDQIIYKTKMPFKVKVIQEKHLKDRYPGPGQYDPKYATSKSFHYGEQAFGSVLQEEHDREQQSIPGPGYYQLNTKASNTVKDEIRKTREKIFGKSKMKMEKVTTLEENHKEQIRKQCMRELQSDGNKFYSLEERCTSKLGNFAQSERFKQETLKKEKAALPGPGQYKLNKSQQKIQRMQYAFNSTQDRLQLHQEHQKIPFYDIDRNDMGKRALRIKKNIENLKQIDIEKAPFNCKQKRFQQQSPNPKNQEELLEMNWNPLKTSIKHERPYRSINQFEMEVKRHKTEKNQHSVFKSKTKRSWMMSSNEVGPGNYNYTATFEKKSFNQEYHYKPPNKIRSTYRTRSSLA